MAQILCCTQNILCISMRPGSSKALLATEVNRLIILVELERKGQWGKKANSFIHWEGSYCLDAEAVLSTLWKYPAGLMLDSYVPPVMQDRRVLHSYSTHQVLTSVHFVFKNLEPEISRVLLHWEAAETQLGILFGWAARTTEDNSVFVTSMWTAFLLEMLAASILHKLQKVCKSCFMKRTAKEMMLPTQVWESKSETFHFKWKLITPNEGITEPASKYITSIIITTAVNRTICKAYLPQYVNTNVD